MKLEERLLGLERALSTLSGHEGWVIGKCRFELAPMEKGNADAEYRYHLDILRENRNLAEIGIRSEDERDNLTVTLMRPSEKAGGQSGKTGNEPEQAGNFFVSREETDRYLSVSGDKNPIHQGENAIVPGFLMVNRIAGMFESPENLRVRFFTPLPVGKPAELVIRNKDGDGQNAEVYRNGERILKIETD